MKAKTRVQGKLTRILAHIIAEPAEYHAALKHDAYRTFNIPKADGGVRTIHAPGARLNAAQRHALEVMQEAGLLQPSDSDHGFVKGRGIHTALAELQPPRAIVQADLAKAFHQVQEDDVREWAKAHGANARTARWLARGTCQHIPGLEGRRLVMGSPLAPALLLALTSDLRAATERLARVYGGKCVWYADNIILEVGRKNAGRLKRALARLIKGQRWEVKAEPDECGSVFGWRFHGSTGQAPQDREQGGGWGWRSSRRRRKAMRGQWPRAWSKHQRLEAAGLHQQADALRYRWEGRIAYANGPAAGRKHAPAYIPATL